MIYGQRYIVKLKEERTERHIFFGSFLTFFSFHAVTLAGVVREKGAPNSTVSVYLFRLVHSSLTPGAPPAFYVTSSITVPVFSKIFSKVFSI